MAVACPSLSASEALCPGMCVSTSPLRRLQASSGWVFPAPGPPPPRGPRLWTVQMGFRRGRAQQGRGLNLIFPGLRPRAPGSDGAVSLPVTVPGARSLGSRRGQPGGLAALCASATHPGPPHPGPDRLMGPRWDAVLSLTCNFVIAKYKRPVDIANPLELPRHRAWLVFGYTCPPVGFKGVLCLTSTFAFEPF